MGVFKNGVGRPSNETIKKRKIIYVLSALAVVAAIASTAYMLNSSFSSKKIKGDADGGFSTSYMKEPVNGIFYEILESDTVKLYNPDTAFVKPSNKGINLRISNSNNYNVYYKIVNSDQSEIIKKGVVKANSKLVVNVNMKSFFSVWTYKTENDLNNSTNWLVGHYFDIFTTKSYVVYNGYSWLGGHIFKYRVSEYLDEKNIVFGDKSLSLKNYSEKNYYYRTFLYRDEKVNGTKLASRGKCKLLKAKGQVFENDGKTMTISNKNKKGTYQVKLYKNKSACNADTLGISKYNVVETLHERNVVFVKKDSLYAQFVNLTGEPNKLSLLIDCQENYKKIELLVYEKKKGTTKYNKVLNEIYNINESRSSETSANGLTKYMVKSKNLNSKNIKSYKVYIRLLDENGNSDESISINNWKPEGYKIVNKDGNKWATRTYNIK